MTETIAIEGITRPLIHEDLPDYEQAPHQVVKIEAEYLVRFPTMGAHLMAALAEAKKLGLSVTAEGAIVLPKTETELNTALRRAQESWDRDRDRYLAAVADPSSVEPGFRRTWVDSFAARENLPAVEWPA